MVARGNMVTGLVRYIVLGLILLIMVGPLVWMFRVSVLEAGSALSNENMFSTRFTLENFTDLFGEQQLGRYLFNSLFVAMVVTLGNVLFCVMVGYVVARSRHFASRLMFATIVIVLMIPAHIIIIPLYLVCLKLGFYDSYWALILPWLINPIGIFLTRQYIQSLPPSMEEAARVDGASELRILLTIVMPLCKPIIAVLAVLAFITNWNSFLFPFILTSSAELRTLPVALALMQGHQAIDWQHLMAGSVIAVVPILILFFLMQRQIVSGITAGGIKQ